MREAKAPKRLCVPLRLYTDSVEPSLLADAICAVYQSLKWGPLVCLLVFVVGGVVVLVAACRDVFCFESTTCIKEPLYDKINCKPSKGRHQPSLIRFLTLSSVGS